MGQSIVVHGDNGSDVTMEPVDEGKDATAWRHYEGRQFVLGLGGSFNPVHVGHIEMLLRGKDVLERLYDGGRVVAGFLACALEGHVARKTSSQAIAGPHRRRMAELAAAGHDWIKPTGRLYHSASHCMAVERGQRSADQPTDVQVQLIGGDYASYFVGGGVAPDSLVVLFQRRPHTDGLAARGTPTRLEHVFWIGDGVLFVDNFDYNVSSTDIRQRMPVLATSKSADEVIDCFRGLLDPNVARYLYDHFSDLFISTDS